MLVAQRAGQAGEAGVRYVTFNQDNTCVALCTDQGLRIFSLPAANEGGGAHLVYREDRGGLRAAEMLFCTSLLALVGAGLQAELSPRRVRVINSALAPGAAPIAELAHPSAVLAVRLNTTRLVAVLDTRAVVYELSSLASLGGADTGINARGLVALAPPSPTGAAYLALPAASSPGTVLVVDATTCATVCEVRAHRSPLVALTLSADGRLLATASERGTVIRVHSLPTGGGGPQAYRRGTLPASIHSLAFGAGPVWGGAPSLLAAASASGAVHLFRLGDHGGGSTGSGGAAGGLIDAVVAAAAAAGGGDPDGGDRAVAILRLPCGGAPALVALPPAVGDTARALVVTATGLLYGYVIRLGTPASCALEREERLGLDGGAGDGGQEPAPVVRWLKGEGNDVDDVESAVAAAAGGSLHGSAGLGATAMGASAGFDPRGSRLSSATHAGGAAARDWEAGWATGSTHSATGK